MDEQAGNQSGGSLRCDDDKDTKRNGQGLLRGDEKEPGSLKINELMNYGGAAEQLCFQRGESCAFFRRDWMWMRSFLIAATMAHL